MHTRQHPAACMHSACAASATTFPAKQQTRGQAASHPWTPQSRPDRRSPHAACMNICTIRVTRAACTTQLCGRSRPGMDAAQQPAPAPTAAAGGDTFFGRLGSTARGAIGRGQLTRGMDVQLLERADKPLRVPFTSKDQLRQLCGDRHKSLVGAGGHCQAGGGAAKPSRARHHGPAARKRSNLGGLHNQDEIVCQEAWQGESRVIVKALSSARANHTHQLRALACACALSNRSALHA